MCYTPFERSYYFNSRPHGGRLRFTLDETPIFTFQLTPSRRATSMLSFLLIFAVISTHALTEGDRHWRSMRHGGTISTHALTEGDCVFLLYAVTNFTFQLTPSRRATFQPLGQDNWYIISTHALTEGDCGLVRTAQAIAFQLTPSRRATANLDKFFF